MRILPALASAFVLSACSLPPVNRSSDVPIGPVAQVDVARYTGKWFEIARLPNSFEENCEGVTAEYTSRPDGRVTVLNTCRQGSPSGEARAQEGVARIVDRASNAKLKVSFGGPFEGDYWVLDRAEDYSWSLVGEPSGRFLWILARAPTISDATRETLLGRLQARGYDTAKLKWTQQPPG